MNWKTIRTEINPAAYDIQTSERCLDTNLEYRDAKAIVDAWNDELDTIRLAFDRLEARWLHAEKRQDMNAEMDDLKQTLSVKSDETLPPAENDGKFLLGSEEWITAYAKAEFDRIADNATRNAWGKVNRRIISYESFKASVKPVILTAIQKSTWQTH